ncbi:MAG: hypothetical protein HC893_12180 [Chloroflexaceae bacterium]|nr:hypothetical protein [Chloroflexaceae bacterium]
MLPDVAPPPPQPAAYVPPITGGYGPLLLLESDDSIPDILPNGIDGARGELLVTMDSAAARTLAVDNPEPDNLRELHNLKEHYAVQFPLIYGVDYDDLAQTRWAVIVNSTDDAAVLKALTPLIAHRSRQQGITLPPLTFRTGETCGEWLARHLPDPTVPCSNAPLSCSTIRRNMYRVARTARRYPCARRSGAGRAVLLAAGRATGASVCQRYGLY